MSENKRPRGPMMGPGRGAVVEKPKNFRLTLIKLIKYAKNYVPAIIIALIFSLVSTLLQILGPNKLREMTDIILLGLPRIVDGVQVSQGIDVYKRQIVYSGKYSCLKDGETIYIEGIKIEVFMFRDIHLDMLATW